MQSDVTTSSSYSSSNSESELSENVENVEENGEDDLANDCMPASAFYGINLLQPVSGLYSFLTTIFVFIQWWVFP